eukprot:jgi/Mesvir1/19019/Mv12787-RA.1
MKKQKIPLVPPAMKSRKKARKITSEFHRLEQAIVEAARSKTDGDVAAAAEIKRLQAEMDKLGGRRAYQEASMVSTKHFSTSKWAIGELQSRGFKRPASNRAKVLEVGAINTQLKKCSWLDVRAIDLNSVDPLIEERDFFTLRPLGEYDAVVCSMVLNSGARTRTWCKECDLAMCSPDCFNDFHNPLIKLPYIDTAPVAKKLLVGVVLTSTRTGGRKEYKKKAQS